MALYVFARFHASAGNESAVTEALGDILPPTRLETGCLSVHAFRSTRDPRLFYIHSRWIRRRCLRESRRVAAYHDSSNAWKPHRSSARGEAAEMIG